MQKGKHLLKELIYAQDTGKKKENWRGRYLNVMKGFDQKHVFVLVLWGRMASLLLAITVGVLGIS